MNKKTFAKEWIVFLSGFSFGILIFPAVITFLLTGELKELEGFYKGLFNKHTSFIAWVVIVAPYLLTQFFRVTAWSIKQLKQK